MFLTPDGQVEVDCGGGQIFSCFSHAFSKIAETYYGLFSLQENLLVFFWVFEEHCAFEQSYTV